ncbi:MAG: divalent-cation tolerance protein CutA [Chlamydiales bacterium]|nr:divalent-cation tolerance protein CutA [Chlamydiales bacterium]
MDAEYIEITWTAGSIDEARMVSRYLVQERLVACAQIIPWIESIYMWDNKLETSQETKVALKTRAANYDKVKEVVLKNAKYELPEITFRRIDGGNKEYMDWMGESTMEGVATYDVKS